MEYKAIRYWDNSTTETVLGSFSTRVEAEDTTKADFLEFDSQQQEHVRYRIEEES